MQRPGFEERADLQGDPGALERPPCAGCQDMWAWGQAPFLVSSQTLSSACVCLGDSNPFSLSRLSRLFQAPTSSQALPSSMLCSQTILSAKASLLFRVDLTSAYPFSSSHKAFPDPPDDLRCPCPLPPQGTPHFFCSSEHRGGPSFISLPTRLAAAGQRFLHPPPYACVPVTRHSGSNRGRTGGREEGFFLCQPRQGLRVPSECQSRSPPWRRGRLGVLGLGPRADFWLPLPNKPK